MRQIRLDVVYQRDMYERLAIQFNEEREMYSSSKDPKQFFFCAGNLCCKKRNALLFWCRLSKQKNK
jgi:hypothetical protein